jgi:hypothetical protein
MIITVRRLQSKGKNRGHREREYSGELVRYDGDYVIMKDANGHYIRSHINRITAYN